MDITTNINNHPISANKQLSMLSYNPTGWGNVKIDLINTLLITHSILICAVQEHFQLQSNLYKLDCFENYAVFSIPARKNDNVVNKGRPSGGLALIYHQKLGKIASPLKVPGSHRVQGLKLAIPDYPMLLINVYFPNDPRTIDFNDTELLQTLEDIKYLVNSVGNDHTIVLMGDMNVDFDRNTTFVDIVTNFCMEINVESVWSRFTCDFTYYHERRTGDRTIVSESTIDHFCISSHSFNAVVEATPLHIKENTSNHDPIFLKMDKTLLIPMNTDMKKDDVNKLQWNKATTDNISAYKSMLSNYISQINVDEEVLACSDVHCNSELHKSRIDELCNKVFDSITIASESNIPLTQSNNSKTTLIPGWTDYIQEYKEQSVFWKALWLSAGRPIDNDLHRNMKFFRNQYHYAIRRVKNHETKIRKNKFAQACLDNNINDIFEEIRKMRNKTSQVSKVIDGKCNTDDIAEHFKQIYDQIYNSQNDSAEMTNVKITNSHDISARDLQFVNKITPNAVKRKILNFHNGKNDSHYKWRSDALKHGVDILANPLSDLIKSIIIHGYIPPVFLFCSLIPIIKDNTASKLSSSNYRLIAITSLLLKLIDHMILEICQEALTPSIHQFGFQRGKSTTLCTFAVKETINFFRNRGSSVFLCLLDLTKAFDCVILSTLFKKLSDKIPPIMIRILIYSYNRQKCVVSWDDYQSSQFGISNGVRQGAVLSPALFNIYIDDLYEELRKTGQGCMINNVYFGCFSYADDIALLAPSREALQRMINHCQNFFQKHGISISTNQNVKKTKTKVLLFGVKSKPTPLCLNGKELPIVESWYHLGHLIHSDESPFHDLEEKRRAIVGKIHSLNQELGPQNPEVFFKLLRSYVLHLYGCPLWDIYADKTVKLWSTWHRTVKMIFELPYATHRYLLNDLVGYDHPKKLIIKRFIKFHNVVMNSSSPHIKILQAYQSKDMRSTYGKNIRQILNDSGASCISEVDISKIIVNPVPEGNEWRIHLLKYLLNSRDNHNPILSPEVILRTINYICVY